jgi:low affinity Fe/Cu permease
MFSRFAQRTAQVVGSPVAFCLACAVIVAWVVSGPVFGWSDTWQLIINTGTTIVTFLVVFLIQHTQNSGDEAIHAKLDALIVGCDRVNDRVVALETKSPDEIAATKRAIDEQAR